MKKSDLMGLGVSPFLAERQATEPYTIAAAGTSIGTATAIGRSQYLCTVSSGSGGVKVPNLGGDTGCLLGDAFIINNQSGSSITVYVSGNATFTFGGSSVAGATGITVSNHQAVTLYSLTSTQWMGLYA